MVFNLYKPESVLRPFIQCYLEANALHTKSKSEYILFPNGYSGVFFNFGAASSLHVKRENQRTPDVSVFGQIDHYFTAIHEPGFYSIGVLLHPTILARLLREDAAQFTNKATDGTLLRNDLRQLHEQLLITLVMSSKIQILNNFFSKVLLPIAQQPNVVDYALHAIHHQPTCSVQELAKKLHVSERHLEVQFKRHIGLSPKTYTLIMRFKRIEEHIRNSSRVHWKDMLFVNEFHDQNHFIKDFKRFTGQTPSSYLLQNFEMGQSYLHAR
ncbi:MAG: AraC family transcriptional regulator [Cyclobacteriaceae bacterium]|nr:AraC family transcriptional regulator [Cyclobacteriaceae bacterium]